MSNPLSEEEINAIRELISADDRRKWLVSAIKGVSVWLAALAAGYLALKGLLVDFIGFKQ